MNRTFAAALLALCLAPSAALAEGVEGSVSTAAPASGAAAAPVAAEPPAPWSLGAGFGYALYGPGVPMRSPGAILLPSAPTAQASLERAMAPGWWLVLGAVGSIYEFKGDAPAGSYQSPYNGGSTAAVSIGARRALTRPGAPVTVSAALLLSGGYTRYRDELSYATPVTRRGEAWGVGLSLGLAVERELTTGLSLRVASPLLGASWSRARENSSADGVSTSEGGGASLYLSPSLELRLAF